MAANNETGLLQPSASGSSSLGALTGPPIFAAISGRRQWPLIGYPATPAAIVGTATMAGAIPALSGPVAVKTQVRGLFPAGVRARPGRCQGGQRFPDNE